MATSDDENGNYPAGYTSIGQRVDATIQRIRGIDRQMENVPQDSRPVPTPRPPGMHTPFKPPGERERTLNQMRNEREQTLTDAWAQIEKETPITKDKDAGVARDKARESLFPNPYRQLSKEDRFEQRTEVKDFEKSQNYTDALRRSKAAERIIAPEPSQPTLAHKEETKPLSFSERYIKNLDRYTKQGREMVKLDPTPTKE